MRSFTSNSELSDRAADAVDLRSILTLLTICATVFMAFEAFARLGVPRLSSFVRRNFEELAQAQEMRPDGERSSVLIAGNSLLLEGIDFPRLQTELGRGWTVRRLVIEHTSYADWYFGLRKLYGRGARFDHVVLMLSPTNLVQTSVRGDYFALLMMQPSDFWRVGQMVNLHRTETTNLLFASWSSFYGLKTELRKVLLLRLLPNLPKFTAAIVRFERGNLEEANLRKTGGARLRDLKALVEDHGGRFTFAIPPLRTPAASSEAVRSAGSAENVPVIVSIPHGEFGADYFRDGFHLNSRGAAVYTDRFVPDLRRTLESLETGSRASASPAAP
jgi:hypothetical protein